MSSISTLSATLLVKAYHCAHVYSRWTLKFLETRSEKLLPGQGVSKCVIFDVDSIFGVRIVSENFSHYAAVVGLRTFRVVKVRISVFVIFEANLLGIYAADFCQILTHCTASSPPSMVGERC